MLSRAAVATHANVYTAPGRLDPPGRALRSRSSGCSPAAPVAARRSCARIESGAGPWPRGSPTCRRVTVFVDTGFFTTVSGPVADRRRDPRGTRQERRPAEPESGPVDLRPSSPSSTRTSTCATSDIGADARRPARRNPQDPQAARRPRRAASGRGRRPPPAGPARRRRPRPARPAAASGCVSLSSTPSQSTASGRSLRLVDPVPAARTGAARPRARPRSRARPRGVRGRGRLLPPARADRARPRERWPRCDSTAPASSSRRPAPTSTSADRSSTTSWSSIVLRADARRARGRSPALRAARARARRRVELGHRPRRSTSDGSGPPRSSRTIVTTAEAGAPKPDPAVFRLALDRLGVEPERALHVGDEAGRRAGRTAAGHALSRRLPLSTAFEGWS